MIAWKIPNLQSMDGFIGFARCGRIPVRMLAPWNGFDAARITCFTAFRCNKRLIKRSILTSTHPILALAKGAPQELAQKGTGTVIESPSAGKPAPNDAARRGSAGFARSIWADQSLVHAAYYSDDECIDRIADWIAGGDD